MKVDERWFSWATAVAAVLAVLVLMVQALLTHRTQERRAAADIQRDLMDLVQAATILDRRLESGLRDYEAVVCGRAEVEVALTDGRDGKRALRGELRMRADLAALGAATSRASVDEALDGLAFASRRLPGELSLLHAASEWLERRLDGLFAAAPALESSGGAVGQSREVGDASASSPDEDDANPPDPNEREFPGGGPGGCVPRLQADLAGAGEAKAVIEFLQAVAQDLAASPACELFARSRTGPAELGEGWADLGSLVDRIDKGEGGNGRKLRKLFDDIDGEPALDR